MGNLFGNPGFTARWVRSQDNRIFTPQAPYLKKIRFKTAFDQGFQFFKHTF
jgi:hypothetical protein